MRREGMIEHVSKLHRPARKRRERGREEKRGLRLDREKPDSTEGEREKKQRTTREQ